MLLFIALGSLVILACCCLLLVGAVGLGAFTYAQMSVPAPAMVLILAPDTTATVSPDDLDAARTVVQKRLEASGVPARVMVDGNRLRVEFADPVNLAAVSQLVTEVGAIVFWDSPRPVPVGTATPPAATVILTDADVAQARAVFADTRWQVAVTLTSNGAQKLAAYTQANVGHYLVIARDGVALSSPIVTTPILDGQAVITGQFDAAAARTLVAQLTGGRLPYPLVVARQVPAGPDVGETR